jgi:hypothetical protein
VTHCVTTRRRFTFIDKINEVDMREPFGPQWCSRFTPSRDVSALTPAFAANVVP